MELTPYVDRLRADLSAVAETAGPDARATAERLAAALDPAVRMALLEALSDAAAEITVTMPSGAVEVRMKGRDPHLVVAAGPEDQAAQHPASVDASGDDDADGGAVARITVRIPETVKARAEELAAGRGQSLNSWIGQALRSATRERAIDVDIDLSSLPFGADSGFGPRKPRRIQGWAR
jgi:hypothetical protein